MYNHIDKNERIYVAGHTGFLGSAIVEILKKNNFKNIVTVNHSELNLLNQKEVNDFFFDTRPSYVFMCAAYVSVIKKDIDNLDEYLYCNSMMQFNTMYAAHKNFCKKFCFISSDYIYNTDNYSILSEEKLNFNIDKSFNIGYTLSKILGLKYCDLMNNHYPNGTEFFTVIPCNLYGPNDCFKKGSAHVVADIIRKIHYAKINRNNKVILFGSGKPIRKFLYIKDAANACLFAMNYYNKKNVEDINMKYTSWINVSPSEYISIKDLASLISSVIGYSGEIIFDNVHPDGSIFKAIDSKKINKLGWKSSTSIIDGILNTYKFFLSNESNKDENLI